MDLSKQQVLHADATAIQQINFTANLIELATQNLFHFRRSKGN